MNFFLWLYRSVFGGTVKPFAPSLTPPPEPAPPPPSTLVASAPAPSAAEVADALAEGFEGFSASPYPDPTGIWTIGYGSTRDANENPITAETPPITKNQAIDLLTRDMSRAFQTVAQDVKVPLNTDEQAALADFIYNVGSGNFLSSSLLKMLDAGQYEQAAQQLLLWDHAGGVVLAGLLRRRQAELNLFETPT